MTSTNVTEDKAGQAYWEELWASGADSLPPAATARDWRTYLDSVLRGITLTHLIEVGCANSPWLRFLAERYRTSVSGLDYSSTGCQKTRELLDRAGITARIVCADVFSPPAELIERADVAVSFGLAEHFAETSAVLRAIARLVRPGGLVITAVPNLVGLVGAGQWLLDRDVLAKHLPLTADALAMAHGEAGLRVVSSRYVGPLDFHACNAALIDRKELLGQAKHLLFRILCRISRVIWFAERRLTRLPQCRLISSHVFCTAVRE